MLTKKSSKKIKLLRDYILIYCQKQLVISEDMVREVYDIISSLDPESDQVISTGILYIIANAQESFQREPGEIFINLSDISPHILNTLRNYLLDAIENKKKAALNNQQYYDQYRAAVTAAAVTVAAAATVPPPSLDIKPTRNKLKKTTRTAKIKVKD